MSDSAMSDFDLSDSDEFYSDMSYSDSFGSNSTLFMLEEPVTTGNVKCDVVTRRYKWIVPNFVKFLDDETKKVVKSAVLNDSTLRLQMESSEWNTERGFFTISLMKPSICIHSTLNYKASLWLLDKKGLKLNLNATFAEFSGDVYVAHAVIKKKFFLDHCIQTLNMGMLTVGCKFRLCTKQELFYQSHKPAKSTLVHQLTHSFQDETLSDVSLICKDQEFRSNRYILSLRSSVFKTMFSIDSNENKTGKVYIDDIEPKVLETLLNFLSTDNVKDDQISLELLSAADKYDIELLFFICEYKLGANLKISNAIETFAVAHQHNAKHLLAKVCKFIFHNFSRLKKSPDLQLISKEQFQAIIEIASNGFAE